MDAQEHSTGTAPQPYSLVWAPIPVLSWIWPMIGHVGIAKSDGKILDFAVTLREGDMAFGGPARYLPLKPESAVVIREQVNLSVARLGGGAKSLGTCWDDFLSFSADVFRRREYSFLNENCHSFVAHFLNSVRYGDYRRWDHVQVAWLIASRGTFVDGHAFLKTALPAAITLGLMYKLLGGAILVGLWLVGLLALVLWFAVFVNCAHGPPRNMLVSV
jgi:hypothetical protein